MCFSELLANKTGQMVGVFENLGQFYSDCLEFKEKSVNFTPGKSTIPTPPRPLVVSSCLVRETSRARLCI